MSRMGLALIAGLVATALVAAPVPKSLKQRRSDELLIVGQWVETPGARSVWLFRADGTAGVGDPANPSCKAIYKLDPTQTPKHLDWSQDGGNSWHLGIYELDGDSLKVNFGGGGSGVRPTVLGPNTGFQWLSVTRKPDTDK